MSASPRPVPHQPERLRVQNGFTLVEVLIALVVSGILVGIALRFVQAQTRFAEVQHAREEVQQNLRSSLDLIASELRGVSPGTGGILTAGATSLTVRVPQAYGVACNVTSNGDTLNVLFPPASEMQLRFNSATPLLVPPTGGGTPDSVPASRLLTSAASLASARTACNAALAPSPPASDARQFVLGSAAPAGLDPGTPVVLVERVRYRSRTPPSAPGSAPWLYRSNGMNPANPTEFDMQPLAGPLQTEGLRFRYYSAASADALPLPLASPQAVSSIGVSLAVESRNPIADRRQRAEDSVRVGVRN